MLLPSVLLFFQRPTRLDGVGGYEMACGHCRRPRKEILAFNFDQLCWIRGLSSSPKSQGGSKVVLRGSKMAPEIASWDPENSPGRPEAHPGRALALPAPRKAPGSVRAAADCTSPGGRPGGASAPSGPQPTSPPSPLENISLHFSYYLFPYVSTTPHARRGRRIFVAGAVYEMACGHCRRPRRRNLPNLQELNATQESPWTVRTSSP